jgi:amidophosphoribosyltransferase
MPSSSELIASSRSEKEVEQIIGADALIYQSIEDLVASVAEENPELTMFDCSIFNGQYVTGDIDQHYLSKLETARKN